MRWSAANTGLVIELEPEAAAEELPAGPAEDLSAVLDAVLLAPRGCEPTEPAGTPGGEEPPAIGPCDGEPGAEGLDAGAWTAGGVGDLTDTVGTETVGTVTVLGGGGRGAFTVGVSTVGVFTVGVVSGSVGTGDGVGAVTVTVGAVGGGGALTVTVGTDTVGGVSEIVGTVTPGSSRASAWSGIKSRNSNAPAAPKRSMRPL